MTTDPDRLLDLLAAYDAGLPVDPTVLDDPRARRMLDALAAARAELAAVPPSSPPPELTARWSAALAGAAQDTARADPGPPPASARAGHGPRHGGPPVGDRGPERGSPGGRSVARTTVGATPDRTPSSAARPGSATRGPRRGGRRPRPAVVAGLLLVVVLVVAGVLGTRADRPSVTAAQLGGIARAAVGVRDAGALTDPVRRAACLRAVAPPGLAPDAPLAGSRTVVFEGHPGVILLLITGRLGVFRAVVVDPGCGAGGGTLLADTTVAG